MPVVAAAVCPSPPLLVPEIAGAVAAETQDLREACLAAAARLVAASPEVVVVVAGGTEHRSYGPEVAGSFAAYGTAGVTVGPSGAGDVGLPLGVLLGHWILERSGVEVPRETVAVDSAAPAADCLEIGAGLAADGRRLALLVIGDGSARRSEHAPAHLHPAAEAFDQVVSRALGTADREVLSRLDPYRAQEVAAAGRAAWQVLAGATGGTTWVADLLYSHAPYGVGYFVATWQPAG